MKQHAVLAIAALAAGAAAAPQVLPIDPRKESTVRVGDGSPRQAYLYQKVTPDSACAQQSCGISSMDVTSTTITWNGGLSYGWIDGGFSVAQTKASGHTATCTISDAHLEDSPNVACVWVRIPHTGYEVEVYDHVIWDDPTEGNKLEGPLYIWSPNDNMNDGHGYVCAFDDECHHDDADGWWGYQSKGDALWDSVSNRGGPQPYVWGSDPDNRWN